MVRRFLTGWAVMLCCVMSLPAADNPQQARIARAEAEVRAGPSEKFPITATLHANDLVAVRRPASDGKWLEIVPPAGSFSWIADRLVTSSDRAGVLSALGDELPLRVGSPGFSYPLEVAEKEKVKRGAILIVRGEKIVHD